MAKAAVTGTLFLSGLVGVAAIGALGVKPPNAEAGGTAITAVPGIPPAYLALYVQADARYKIDWAVLAAIGKIETDHGRIQGGRCATSSAGARGPMQFMPGTWAGYGNGGNICDPADAIPAAARYLKASGAPGDYRRALLAYNHAGWYVDKVMAQARKYRREAVTGAMTTPFADADERAVLANVRIHLTPGQRADVASGGLDARLLSSLNWLGQRHDIQICALRKDHAPGTNHEAGRAADICAVDLFICRGGTNDPCADALRELANVRGPNRCTECIYLWDADPADPGFFAKADHADHIHMGWDG